MILRTQQEASIDGIIVVDGDDSDIVLQPAFRRYVGYLRRKCMEGRSDISASRKWIFGKTGGPRKYPRLYLDTSTKRVDKKSRAEVVLKDGRSFDRYSAPMLDANGKYYGRVWYFRDITERKQAPDRAVEGMDGL